MNDVKTNREDLMVWSIDSIHGKYNRYELLQNSEEGPVVKN